MNRNQRFILISTAFILLVMLLFPPFKIILQGGGSFGLGHSFIFYYPTWNDDYIGLIDFASLLTQALIVIFIGGILFLALKSKNDNC